MKLFCGLIFFLVLISSALSLKCYLCEGTNGTACARPEDSSSLKGILCPINQTAIECVTFAYKLESGLVNTARGCSPKGFCDEKDNIPFFDIVHCETCTEDLCNSSFQPSANAMVISLLILSVSLFLSKMFQ